MLESSNFANYETAVHGTDLAHAWLLRCKMEKQLGIVVFLLILSDSCYHTWCNSDIFYTLFLKVYMANYYAKILDRVSVLP
jgi:hypothetical protein